MLQAIRKKTSLQSIRIKFPNPGNAIRPVDRLASSSRSSDRPGEYLAANGDKDWIVYGGTRVTFRQAQILIDQVGAELSASFGVKQGTVVSIAMRNIPEYMIAFLAITSMGAVGVPLNSLWGTQELEYAIKDSDTKVIFGDIQRTTFFHDEILHVSHGGWK